MIKKLLRTLMRLILPALFILPQLVMAGNDDPQCESEVPLSFTKQEMAEAGFEPGGFTPFILGMIVGPRIGLEWNDGRNVRTIEVLRALPYAGNLVGLFFMRGGAFRISHDQRCRRDRHRRLAARSLL